MRPSRGGRGDPPVLPSRLPVASALHGAGNPAHVAGQRHLANGVPRAGRGRGLPVPGRPGSTRGARRRGPPRGDRRARAGSRDRGRRPGLVPVQAHRHRTGPGAPADRPAPGAHAAGGRAPGMRLGGARHRGGAVDPGRARAPGRAPGHGGRLARAPGGPPFGLHHVPEPVALPGGAGPRPVGFGVPAHVPRGVLPLPAVARVARRRRPAAPDGPGAGDRRGAGGRAVNGRRRGGRPVRRRAGRGRSRGPGLRAGHGERGRGSGAPLAAGGPAVLPGVVGRDEARLRGRARHALHDLAGLGRERAPRLGDDRGARGDLAPVRAHGGPHPPGVGGAGSARPAQALLFGAVLVGREGRGDGPRARDPLRVDAGGGPRGAAGALG